MAEMTVESVCNALAKSKLLGGDEIKKAYQDWQREGGPKAKDTAEFGKWLIARQYLTSYQADRVLRGQTDHFFFNEYKLLDRIGKGKMAGVYKGMHRLGQVVAIKVLPPSKVKDTEAFGRFQRESRLAQRLKHANVVRTFQVGQSGPLHYLVMEHLEGETLADMIQRRGKLPPVEAAQIVYQALLGLAHIDEQKMVHRDLTPENLMILPPSVPGEPGVVKILDIGLGRATFEEGGGVNDVNLTREDSVLGSPDYLAPEQARSAHTADIRADIYSLGCVLYHAIAGQVVFPSKNAVQKMIAHASEKPRPLSTFVPNVPDALQQIVDSMIAKEPSMRYATPALAARQVKAFLESQTVSTNAPQLAELVPAYANWLESTEIPMIAEAIPVPAPVGGAPVAVAVPMSSPAGVNVELVPVQAPAAASTGFGMRSALLLLIVGASGMLVLLCGGWLAFQFLGNK